MKIFRKIRVSAILEHKVSKYILYAIGEILLVIIGILIAVSINNSNEKRKQKAELQQIYQTVAHDLIRDTIALIEVLEESNELDSLTRNYLLGNRPSMDTIDASNLENCSECGALFSSYRDFTPSLGGYQSLIDFESKSDIKRDSLTDRILNFYSGKVENIKDLSSRVGDMAVENIQSLEKYQWYAPYFLSDYNEEGVRYFLTSKEYENKLFTFYLMNAGSLNPLFQKYKDESVALIEEIKRLD